MIENYMWIIWLVVFVLSLGIEALTSELVSIWFGVGSLIAVFISLIKGVPWWIELIVFVTVSLATLLCLRPIVNKILNRREVKTNVDEIVGKKGVMLKDADDLNHGEVKINGVIWTAVVQFSQDVLNKGDIVKVLAVDGNKLIVAKTKK